MFTDKQFLTLLDDKSTEFYTQNTSLNTQLTK